MTKPKPDQCRLPRVYDGGMGAAFYLFTIADAECAECGDVFSQAAMERGDKPTHRPDCSSNA